MQNNIFFFFFDKGPEENVASLKFKSQVIQGDFREPLLDESNNYDMEKGKKKNL